MRPRRRARLLLAALLLVALAGWQGWQCHASPALPFTAAGSGHHASADTGFAAAALLDSRIATAPASAAKPAEAGHADSSLTPGQAKVGAQLGSAKVRAEVDAHLGTAIAAGGTFGGHEEPAAMLACLSFLATLAVALFVLARPLRVLELVSQAREAVSVGWFGARTPRLAQLGVMRT
ncbi:hypothetical protein [Catelliglobosispora koreensis]|uniref:hypothetical protein n=1 Tax=Catelliglobosispora koreensis TaxID=129052 RepID=UPI0003651A7D|nr:hypothetical protein [Catelliglobosispora koreensis]